VGPKVEVGIVSDKNLGEAVKMFLFNKRLGRVGGEIIVTIELD
jgi:hypothetical protein